jgi:deoxyribodipyrimidine photo-lyase
LARIREYFWETKNILKYKQTRNGLIGPSYSTKFSPWLAFGCISSRYILSEVQRFEAEVQENDSTYWVWFELLWRDYFRLVAMKFGNEIFKETGITRGSKTTATPKWIQGQEGKRRFEAWSQGTTGVPFVDANMRELKATGFMSNRGRQNVASYLVKDLQVDWRMGAEWFESNLLDYDPCSNYGNWLYIAGLGNDPREDRYFNVIKQAKVNSSLMKSDFLITYFLRTMTLKENS